MGVEHFGETHRFYRYQHRKPQGWESFRVTYRETDLWVRARVNLEAQAMEAVLTCRLQLETYIASHEDFLRTLWPLPDDPFAPPIARRMLGAAIAAGVGPMASIAGAIAEAVGVSLERYSDSVIVENGGDCYLNMREETTVGLFAGPNSPFTGKIAIKLRPERFPLGVCTSSATVGPSLSFGNADAVTVISKNAPLADAAATRLGNMVKTRADIDKALALAPSIPTVEGVLIAIKDKIGIWGNVELAPV
ncbi:MAG: UPF0280 family protein [Syntrophobacteraceae bacterium]|nr:UPF0280 family protein [Syntrophobacteraceae bacterium]